MSAMRFGSETEEAETSYARTTRRQLWLGPEGGNDRVDVYAAIPRYSKDTTDSPANAVVHNFEANLKIADTFVGYALDGRHALHSRGTTLWLNESGQLTGALRIGDAARLAGQFPDQVVHPDAVNIARILTRHPLTASATDGFDYDASAREALEEIRGQRPPLAADGSPSGLLRLFAPERLQAEALYLAGKLAQDSEVELAVVHGEGADTRLRVSRVSAVGTPAPTLPGSQRSRLAEARDLIESAQRLMPWVPDASLRDRLNTEARRLEEAGSPQLLRPGSWLDRT